MTTAGLALAERIQAGEPDAEIVYRPQPFGETVRTLFQAGQRLVFICATGIVVRTLAPVIQDKHIDPPVLVLDDQGRFVIALLSGHEGGANAWAVALATRLKAQPVLTTAKPYVHPVYTLGMGCERHCPVEVLAQLAAECLSIAGLQPRQIAGLASIDIKADETGLIELGVQQGWPYTTWPAARLREVEDQLSQRSEIVFREVGVYGVAEAAALVAASRLTGEPAELLLPKHKNRRATCAIARSFHAG
ncbi:cobalamin biosynthesis protein [Phytohalomonas tamaricis]|uniref:cobalamin biosynthesis protein n=1 Tax=Phytohalomonas tamaricis TaxID=2081032 RepID=UPI0021D40575|nr:cobalamin biosynthesis protein [Phytohalomonas tamaricis]